MSRRTLLAILVGVLHFTLLPTAQAIMVRLDEPARTVARPLDGSIEVLFTGTIDIGAGFEPGSIQASTLVNEIGDQLDSGFPIPRFDTGRFNVSGVLFSVLVSATDALGSYQFGDFALLEPAFIRYFECPIGSTTGCNSSTVNYSLNIVDRVATPEPAAFALLGAGLLLLSFAVRPRMQRAAASQRS